jgi:hypothetical protein
VNALEKAISTDASIMKKNEMLTGIAAGKQRPN